MQQAPGERLVIDAVLAPPGGASGLVTIEPDATVVGAPRLALVGRDSEAVTLGNDTLSRTLDAVIERWADRVINRAGTLTPRPEAP